MSVIDELITDRTQADITGRVSGRCAADYNTLNRVEKACAYIADYLHISVDTKEWEMQEWRTDSQMQRIRKNIQTLKNAYFVKPTTPMLPSTIQYASYIEANQIEQILKDMDDIHESKLSGLNRLSFKLGTKSLGNRRK